MTEPDSLETLKSENQCLIALLDKHGIEWRREPKKQSPLAIEQSVQPVRLSTDEKVALFRRLFRGRTDVYPVRWESKGSGKSGCAPACANEWVAGVNRTHLKNCENFLHLTSDLA